MMITPAQRTMHIGEYYFSKKLVEIELMKKNGKRIINLGIGNPDKAPEQETINVLQRESQNRQNHGYQSYRGIAELREALADWYLRFFGVHLDAEREILPLMGSKEGIIHVSMAFLNPGDEVLTANPSYPAYASAARLSGARVRYYDLKAENGYLPDLKLLEHQDLSKVKIMWVNYPHMPTGSRATKSFFEKLVNFGLRHQILIVNDNPYALILNNRPLSILKIPAASETALELNSMSKSHNMAGWRIGMIAGHRQYIDTVLKIKSNMDSGMFRPLQLAAAHALNNTDKIIGKMNGIYSKRKETAFRLLNKLHCSYSRDTSGMFIWARIPDFCEDSVSFSDIILEQTGVFITPGTVFGSEGKRYLRLSLSNSEKLLYQAIKKIETSGIEKWLNEKLYKTV